MNKHQLIIIHGGIAFDSRTDYLTFLKEEPLSLERLRPRSDWKDSIQAELGEGFDVLRPKMPTVLNAQYEEWRLMFNKMLELTDPELSLIGHSLGGTFLVKYLSEHTVARAIRALYLLAAPYHDEKLDESLGTFRLATDLSGVLKQVPEIHLYYSRDDESVPFQHGQLYQKALAPRASLREFTDRGHFRTEEFPELVADIHRTTGN